MNPSPNAPNLWMARCYAGTVMLEGATLSEGRGTTRPLELFGAPDVKPRTLIAKMESLSPEVAPFGIHRGGGLPGHLGHEVDVRQVAEARFCRLDMR